nr:DUF2846 domain-containing protein [Aeromonas sp. sif2433]
MRTFICLSSNQNRGAPGSHTLTSKSENDATLTLSTEAGKNYYVWQEVKMGLLMARSKLSQVSEEEGKQGVMRASWSSDQIFSPKKHGVASSATPLSERWAS